MIILERKRLPTFTSPAEDLEVMEAVEWRGNTRTMWTHTSASKHLEPRMQLTGKHDEAAPGLDIEVRVRQFQTLMFPDELGINLVKADRVNAGMYCSVL